MMHAAHRTHRMIHTLANRYSYNQSQMQDLINKVDELINALRS